MITLVKTKRLDSMKTKLISILGVAWLGTASLSVLAQNGSFSYQGLVNSGGTPFTGVGQFKFELALGTNSSVQATATANLSGQFVTSYTVTSGGSGYTATPLVHVSGGGGSGASAVAVVSGGIVTAVNPVNAGSGYTNAPTATIDPPPPTITYTTYWSNDGTGLDGSQPAAAVAISVANGLFMVVLGDTSVPNMAAIDPGIFVLPNLQLRIWFNDGVHGFAELLPPQTLTQVPYAIEAENLLGSSLSSIGNNQGGSQNFFVGAAGSSSTTGSGNTAIGQWSLQNLSNGSYNTADGIAALQDNVSGAGNTASGAYSLALNTSGQGNTADGYRALNNSTNGGYNAALGYEALYFNANGSENTAVGAYALFGNYTGSFNTAIGNGALGNLSTGSGNIAIGPNAGGQIFTGQNNIDIGNPGFGDESGVIRVGVQGTHTKAVFNGIYGTTIVSAAGLVCVNPSGLLGTGTAGGAVLNGDLQVNNFHAGEVQCGDVTIGTGAGDYRHVQLGGGNTLGFVYGSFPRWGDGIHMGYNYYADAGGGDHVIAADGGTSRITAGYGEIVLAVGAAGFAPTIPRLDATTAGVTVYGTFNNSSDRNAKQDIAPISSAEILEKVLELPISEWSYKTDPATRHIGPMGQDFHSVFNIGTDEKHIAPIDEGGVALAAIKGLNQKLSEKEREIETLKERLESLEQLVNRLTKE